MQQNVGHLALLSDAERHLTSSLTGLLVAAVPLVGAGLAVLQRGAERPAPVNVVGLLVGFAGVAALVGFDARGSQWTAVLEMAVVAIGYATGEYDQASGAYQIRQSDAHAWPELFIDGHWLPFEPTPIRALPARTQSSAAPEPEPAPAPPVEDRTTGPLIWAGVVVGGCLIRPMPRGIGEITYTIAPRTMIESTLITQSRIVIAVASGSGTP